MATFTGITSARADEILGESVVSGIINGSGHLILSRQNGSTIDAGDFSTIIGDLLAVQVAAKVAELLPDAVAGTVIDKGSVSGAITIPEFNVDNIINAMVKVQLTGNATIDTAALPSAPKANTQFVMRVQQDATGGRTLTFSGFKRAYGTIPLTTTASAVDLIVFVYDGTDWLVGLMGGDFK